MLQLLSFTAASALTDHKGGIFNVTIALGETLPYNFLFLTLLLCQIVHEYGVLSKGAENGCDIMKRQSVHATIYSL